MTATEICDLSYRSERVVANTPLPCLHLTTKPYMATEEYDDPQKATAEYEKALAELQEIRDFFKDQVAKAVADFEKLSEVVDGLTKEWQALQTSEKTQKMNKKNRRKQ